MFDLEQRFATMLCFLPIGSFVTFVKAANTHTSATGESITNVEEHLFHIHRKWHQQVVHDNHLSRFSRGC